ncbi:hypothetical protein FRC09_012894 [Ceratobasidium sp. 395]|nr:hypothetical protein FRC09_012894 [Ceratobasidium sp. 395]
MKSLPTRKVACTPSDWRSDNTFAPGAARKPASAHGMPVPHGVPLDFNVFAAFR